MDTYSEDFQNIIKDCRMNIESPGVDFRPKVCILHIPSGINAVCYETKSVIKNQIKCQERLVEILKVNSYAYLFEDDINKADKN